MWSGEGGEADSWRPQFLPRKSGGPKGGATSDRPRGLWPDISGTTLRTKTEVPGGGELDVENVERGGTYLDPVSALAA